MPAMIDTGTGAPIVLIPGVQGRWEWMRPAVSALASRCRVVACSLPGEPGSGRTFDRAAGFDNFVSQLDDLLNRFGGERPVLCGVSFGGLIAVRYAALRPQRIAGLVLASALPPGWRPDARIRRYLAAPRLFAPLFCIGALDRLASELTATFPDPKNRLRFALAHLRTLALAPLSPNRATERIRALEGIDFLADCRRVTVPVLVITGSADIDRVVPVAGSLEYVGILDNARAVTIESTGHLGMVTQPARFASIVTEFMSTHATRSPDSLASQLPGASRMRRPA